MRSLLIVMIALGGCAADAEEPPLPVTTPPYVPGVMLVGGTEKTGEEVDVCALAAQLPIEDICSLLCDPVAIAVRLIDDGSERGACYQLYCSLPGDAHVLVGVCLPP